MFKIALIAALAISTLNAHFLNNAGSLITPIKSEGTPKAIGPYSEGTKIDLGDKYIFYTSGQIGLDPKTGEFVSDCVVEQTKRALENLRNLLV